jgi:cytochrome c oxidase subunit 4
MVSHDEEVHLVPYRVYVFVWMALVALTCVTVGVHYTDLAHMAIITAIIIAVVKTTLVVMYFMHIRYDQPLFTVMLLAAVATYGIFIILTFADYSFR